MATDVLLQSPPGRGILAALTCPCCYDLLKHALTLPCTHHVCQNCFLALCNGNEQFFCPNSQCGQLVQAGTCIPNPLVQSFIDFLELLMRTPTPAQQPGFGAPNSTVKRSPVGLPMAHGAAYPFKFNLPLQGMYQNSSPATSVGENSACNSPDSIGVSVGGDPPPSVAYKYDKDTTAGAVPAAAATCGVGGLSYHDRTVLTPHQRQYIRYVVVTDEAGSDFTVGIKHVLHTAGSHKLLQLLEKNIGSEYKKRVSQRVCRSVTQGTPCGLKHECPLIHVTQEGWQERRPSMPRTRAEAAAAAIAMGVAFDALKPHFPPGLSDLGPAVAS